MFVFAIIVVITIHVFRIFFLSFPYSLLAYVGLNASCARFFRFFLAILNNNQSNMGKNGRTIELKTCIQQEIIFSKL